MECKNAGLGAMAGDEFMSYSDHRFSLMLVDMSPNAWGNEQWWMKAVTQVFVKMHSTNR